MMKYSLNSSLSSRWKKRLVMVAAAVVVLLLAGGVVVNRWYQANLKPLTVESQEKVVVIELGSSTLDVARQLENEPLIRSARAFSWYVSRLDGNNVIQAGTYRLNSNMPVAEIVEILVSGQVDTSLVTITGGLRLDEVRQVLINAGFGENQVDSALKAHYNHPLMAYLPEGGSLEGYIYPETYQINAASTPQTIIQSALDQFYSFITPDLLGGLKKQNLSLHQAIILASIVHKESYDFEDQRQVAQVFLKRLEMGIPLGADATFRYAAAIAGQEPSVDFESPYNTRINAGLPPGPIANFEIEALKAVASPADSDYLYFVHGDGCHDEDSTTPCVTYFSNTQSEHEANTIKYCREYCFQ